MPSLNRDHRRLLENTVAQARGIGEDGARKVLADQYAVHHHEPWPHMTPEERELRNQLRAHGRQLGDRRDDRRNTQEIDHLVQACAYEHWHRMLFARFLAENDLLLDADHGMAMTLEEVRELAREQNRDWLEIAAELAQKMLLAVFRPEDPVLRVSLPPETRQRLEEKLEMLPEEVFRADDSLGWVYQYWQRDEKDRINKLPRVEVGADELPAVTQLFTEDYMVLFLLENTLGAWWTAARRAEGKDPALPGYEWTYLRLTEDGSPAAGAFDGWPRVARDLRVLDPSMGSGHFLTFALPILVRMRVEQEGLSLQEAAVAVLHDNLFGLELDARCAQIAAFNLAMAAWRLTGEYYPLPRLNLACSGLGINADESQWLQLAGTDGRKRDLMSWLYSLFRNGATLGSLIDPLYVGKRMVEEELTGLLPALEQALTVERSTEDDRELAIAAQGALAAFRILASQFTLVVTNVPYLMKAKQNQVLQSYCDAYAKDAAADLATVFLERCAHFCAPGGTHATVTPQNWLFLKSYASFRRRLITTFEVCHASTIGSGQTAVASWDVLRALVLVTKRTLPNYSITGVETDAAKEEERAHDLRVNPILSTTSRLVLQNATQRLALAASASGTLLCHYADSLQGISTGDNPRFQLLFWEVIDFEDVWGFQQGPVAYTTEYAGREKVIRWDGGEGAMVRSEGSAIRGVQALGRRGVAITQMRSLPATVFSGSFFDTNVAAIVPKVDSHFAAIWAYCSSPTFVTEVRRIDKKINVTNATLAQVPFDFAVWQGVAEKKYADGFPKPHSSDLSQWLFSGDPVSSDHPLQVAVARLVGYRWPRQCGSSFPDAPTIQDDALDQHADSDGIVCLSSVAGEPPAADRLRALLADAYKEEWSAAKLSELLEGCESLEVWLRDRFFEQHCCDLFQQRPFIWHVWDGLKEGFHALVNYHKLAAEDGEGRKTLEKLIYTSLGDWITRQRADAASGVEGADARLGAALHLKSELEKILTGEKPYDIFVRWKPVHEQPIGWEADVNDGVRVNIRPWLTATLSPSTKPKKGACILRVTPKISHGKDRGKEPHRPKEDFPWFWSWDEHSDDFLGGKDFDGARWNDLHYSLETKRQAVERKRKAGA